MSLFVRSLSLAVSAWFFLLVPALPSSAAEATAIAKIGRWGIFMDDQPPGKVCWAATLIGSEPEDGYRYFLAVTKFFGPDAPQISLYANKRLKRSNDIFLSVAGLDYRMQSNGQFAWPEKNADWQIVTALKKISVHPNRAQRVVYASQGRNVRVAIRVDGFGAALSRILKDCATR